MAERFRRQSRKEASDGKPSDLDWSRMKRLLAARNLDSASWTSVFWFPKEQGMPGRGSQTFKKRQKEQQRKEKQQEKMAQRLARKDNPPPSEDDNLTEAVAQPGAEGAEGERRAEENGLNRALRDL
jgi:hypothetical protein